MVRVQVEMGAEWVSSGDGGSGWRMATFCRNWACCGMIDFGKTNHRQWRV